MRAILALIFFFFVVEIALLVLLGIWLGLLPVLGAVLVSAAFGVILIRGRAFGLLKTLRLADDPARALAGEALVLLAALFLIIPGVVSDAVGLALLTSPVRKGVLWGLTRALPGSRREFRKAEGRRQGSSGAIVIEGQCVEVTQAAQAAPDPGRAPETEAERFLPRPPH